MTKVWNSETFWFKDWRSTRSQSEHLKNGTWPLSKLTLMILVSFMSHLWGSTGVMEGGVKTPSRTYKRPFLASTAASNTAAPSTKIWPWKATWVKEISVLLTSYYFILIRYFFIINSLGLISFNQSLLTLSNSLLMSLITIMLLMKLMNSQTLKVQRWLIVTDLFHDFQKLNQNLFSGSKRI